MNEGSAGRGRPGTEGEKIAPLLSPLHVFHSLRILRDQLRQRFISSLSIGTTTYSRYSKSSRPTQTTDVRGFQPKKKENSNGDRRVKRNPGSYLCTFSSNVSPSFRTLNYYGSCSACMFCICRQTNVSSWQIHILRDLYNFLLAGCVFVHW